MKGNRAIVFAAVCVKHCLWWLVSQIISQRKRRGGGGRPKRVGRVVSEKAGWLATGGDRGHKKRIVSVANSRKYESLADYRVAFFGCNWTPYFRVCLSSPLLPFSYFATMLTLINSNCISISSNIILSASITVETGNNANKRIALNCEQWWTVVRKKEQIQTHQNTPKHTNR